MSFNTDNNFTINVKDLSKCYPIYDSPNQRLKQFLFSWFRNKFKLQTVKYFREFWALKDISFTVKKGETVGIIGRNGSGKSTLLQIICGTLSPTSGDVQINGRVAALLELGSGFNPEFTGRENVYLNASVLGLTKQEIDARFIDIQTFADIGDFINQPVKTYSSGMMVRLAFAVIAHVDADILVIDEALAVGDAFFTQKCMRFLRRFIQSGTVLFVSHDTSSIKNLCNRAIWLDKGKLKIESYPKEVCELYLEAFYESDQNVTRTKKLNNFKKNLTARNLVDQRLKFVNNSNLRNDIQIFKFQLNNESFGTGGAEISDVYLCDEEDNHLSWIVGGETVNLNICATAREAFDLPIVGFSVKDRLGQILFGDNTYLTYSETRLPCQNGVELHAKFTFTMPLLAAGDYSVSAAIANGSQKEHTQLHWIHDALIFKSESSSVASGLVGIPMLDIQLGIQN